MNEIHACVYCEFNDRTPAVLFKDRSKSDGPPAEQKGKQKLTDAFEVFKKLTK